VLVDITNPVDLSVLVFMAGDDAEAKDGVARLAPDGGLRPIDAGHSRVRVLEALGFCTWRPSRRAGPRFASAVKVLP
jgi:predicted dinucleotide-binding enzyme